MAEPFTINYAIGMLIASTFCLDDSYMDKNSECVNNDKQHIEMRILTAKNCGDVFDDCSKKVNNILEIEKNGKIILSVDTSGIDPKDVEMLFKTFFTKGAIEPLSKDQLK